MALRSISECMKQMANTVPGISIGMGSFGDIARTLLKKLINIAPANLIVSRSNIAAYRNSHDLFNAKDVYKTDAQNSF